MNQSLITQQLTEWMTTFVEVPNDKLGSFPPCPYARQARINNNISIKFAEIAEFSAVVREGMDTLDNKEVVVVCFNHHDIDPVQLQEWVSKMNEMLMPLNYVILEDHPHSPEYINGVNMNFGKCGLLVIQKLDKLNNASDQLNEKGYYHTWTQKDLDSVVTWRTK